MAVRGRAAINQTTAHSPEQVKPDTVGRMTRGTPIKRWDGAMKSHSAVDRSGKRASDQASHGHRRQGGGSGADKSPGLFGGRLLPRLITMLIKALVAACALAFSKELARHLAGVTLLSGTRFSHELVLLFSS